MLHPMRHGVYVDTYQVSKGGRLVRVIHDREAGWITACGYVNGGETICASKAFETLVGADRWAEKWIREG